MMLRSKRLLFILLLVVLILLYVPSYVQGFDLSLNQHLTPRTIVSTHKGFILYATTKTRKKKNQHSSQNDVNHNNDVVTITSSSPLDLSNNVINTTKDRFDRTASQIRHIDEPCVITIDNTQYNVSSWAKAHPGGVAILQKFHNRNATKAFYAAHHSDHAIAMLQQFAIVDPNSNDNHHQHIHTQTSSQHYSSDTNNNEIHKTPRSSYFSVERKNNTNTLVSTDNKDIVPVGNELFPSSTNLNTSKIKRLKQKLLTKEDPWNIHKCLGIFVLLHFVMRYYQMLFTTDPTGGFGSYGRSIGRSNTVTPSWIPILCLLPHGLLSISSLLFHTVPRDRVIGQPMIWQEYRIHNIGFGIRSVISTLLCTLAIRYQHHPQHKMIRHVAVIGSCLSCLLALIGADLATQYLRSNDAESTTATTPYWDGCSVNTQKRFKLFYAYCQFMATLACLLVTNPAFPFCVLFAIQVASLLMTLVRKGLLSTYGFHMGYTATLIAPYFVALRSILYMKSPELLFVFGLGSILFHLRRHGINKYAIWVPVMVARILYGDKYLTYNIW